MNITITNIDNASALDSFVPVAGEWILDGESESRERGDIEQSVRNYLDADYPIDVKIYDARGHEILDDMPVTGTFIAVRKRQAMTAAEHNAFPRGRW